VLGKTATGSRGSPASSAPVTLGCAAHVPRRMRWSGARWACPRRPAEVAVLSSARSMTQPRAYVCRTVVTEGASLYPLRESVPW